MNSQSNGMPYWHCFEWDVSSTIHPDPWPTSTTLDLSYLNIKPVENLLIYKHPVIIHPGIALSISLFLFLIIRVRISSHHHIRSSLKQNDDLHPAKLTFCSITKWSQPACVACLPTRFHIPFNLWCSYVRHLHQVQSIFIHIRIHAPTSAHIHLA